MMLRQRVCCSCSKFSKWFTRSTCTRSNVILGIATRCGGLRGKTKQHCWLPNIWKIDLNGETAGCTATIRSQSWLRCSKTSAKGAILQRHESKAGDEQVQRGITTITSLREPHRDLRNLWEFCKTSMSWLHCLFSEFGIIHCSCGRRNFEEFAESYNTPEDQLWLYFNPWRCH